MCDEKCVIFFLFFTSLAIDFPNGLTSTFIKQKCCKLLCTKQNLSNWQIIQATLFICNLLSGRPIIYGRPLSATTHISNWSFVFWSNVFSNFPMFVICDSFFENNLPHKTRDTWFWVNKQSPLTTWLFRARFDTGWPFIKEMSLIERGICDRKVVKI